MRKIQKAYRLFLHPVIQGALCLFIFLIPLSGFSIVGSFAPDNDQISDQASVQIYIAPGTVVYNKGDIHISVDTEKRASAKSVPIKKKQAFRVKKTDLKKDDVQKHKPNVKRYLSKNKSPETFFTSSVAGVSGIPVNQQHKNICTHNQKDFISFIPGLSVFIVSFILIFFIERYQSCIRTRPPPPFS